MKPNKKTETTMLNRRNWLKAWIKLRNYDVGVRADNFLFCYHCTNRALYSPELSWQLLQNMNGQLAAPLSVEALEKIASWKLLRITNQKIIMWLGITDAEIETLRIGYNMKLKQERLEGDILLHKILILRRQNSYADGTNFSLDEVLQTAHPLPLRWRCIWLFYLCGQKS